MASAAVPSLFGGFVYALPHQNKGALLATGFAGPFVFAAPVALTPETETAFTQLTLSTPPQQAQPVHQPCPPAPECRPTPAHVTMAASQPSRAPPQQPAAPAGRGGGGRKEERGENDDEDAFFEVLDVDGLVQQRTQQGSTSGGAGTAAPPAPTQRPVLPALGTHQRQERQQQAGGVQQPNSQQQQQPAASGGGSATLGPLCNHGVPYATCMHRQQHLDETTRQAADAAMQMADAVGPQLQALQLEVKRLRALKQLLESTPLPTQRQGQPFAAGPVCSSPHPLPQQQQPYNSSQWGAPAPQQQQQWHGGEGGSGGSGGLSQHTGPADGGYGAGPAGGPFSGPVPAPVYVAFPGGHGMGGGFGSGGFGGGGGYDQGPPPAPWEPDRAALQNVRAERQDATNDPKWRQENFPWSQELRERNHEMFGNRSFRQNQLQIMNATLSGRDVFVLMPTGGGKSLCYQLPALLSQGVTIVVSPLVSLIQDQVHHLTVLGIPAACVGGSMDWEQQSRVYNSLFDQSGGGCKVLFITPEKLSSSGKLQSTLDTLHRRGQLARVCIDEAHCVSQWGHDFRKDYTKLSYFKQKFPSVPLLALTATATPRVQHDVVAQLGIHKCLMFKSSFNRPNLSYEVRKKKKGCVDEIAALIVEKFTTKVQPSNKRSWMVQCGIVYCLARAECERVADELESRLGELVVPMQTGKRRVKHYHASLTPEEREAVQAEWTNGEVPIIVATIAFGMGINKADVAFVFHYSLPKSLEGYLQESGRAGRDGRPSSCILYYTYGDAAKSRHMIRQSAQENGAPEEQVRSNMESLNAMINYCEEQVECRRVMMLSHFGETSFTKSMCRNTCDNCKSTEGHAFVEEDLSEAAMKVVQVVRSIPGASLSAVVDCFRGNNTVGVRKLGHDRVPTYGSGKTYCRNNGEAERLVRRMVVQGVLVEETHRPEMHLAVISTLAVNEAAAARLFAGQVQVKMHVQQKGGGSGGGSKGRARTTKKGGAASGAVAASSGAGGVGYQHEDQQGQQQQAYQQQQGAKEDPIDLCDEDDEDGGGEEGRQRTALIKAALHQLNGELRKQRHSTRGPFATTVQARIAAKGPRNLAELMALDLPGMSSNMKKQYGPQIMAAIQQADAFLPAVLQGACQVDEFRLDSASIFAEPDEAVQPKRQRKADWSSDDDWVDEARPAAGEGSRPPPQKQAKVAPQPAGAAQPPRDLQAFRYNAGKGQPAGGPGSGRQLQHAGPAPLPPQEHQQQVAWPQQRQGGGFPAHQQQGTWPQQRQGGGFPAQHDQEEGWPQQQQGRAPVVQQQQWQAAAPPPQQQQQQPSRPSSAGPFGRRDGVTLKPVQLQPQSQQDDKSPEWRTKKSGGTARPATHCKQALHPHQQIPGIQTGAVNVGDAFASSWGSSRR